MHLLPFPFERLAEGGTLRILAHFKDDFHLRSLQHLIIQLLYRVRQVPSNLCAAEFYGIVGHESRHFFGNLPLHKILYIFRIFHHCLYMHDLRSREAFLNNFGLPLEVGECLGFRDRGIPSVSHSRVFGLRGTFASSCALLILFIRHL